MAFEIVAEDFVFQNHAADFYSLIVVQVVSVVMFFDAAGSVWGAAFR
jgi:hypothetical protein